MSTLSILHNTQDITASIQGPCVSTTTNELARELVKSPSSEYIKIDHLAFSFKLSALRHCHEFAKIHGFVNTQTDTKIDFFGNKSPVYHAIQRTSTYPEIPSISSYKSSTGNSFEKYKNNVVNVLNGFYEETLQMWVRDVLGMKINPMSGKGFMGYKDSAAICEDKEKGVQLGFMGIGGQSDTVYFQISGTGCKHLFTHISTFKLHHWLTKGLNVTKLGRIDLAYDDFDGNFSCAYAEDAYRDDFFRTNPNCRSPKAVPRPEYDYIDGKKVFSQDMFCVGSRTSAIYWRIYDKWLEQFNRGDTEHFAWYRSEAELKKWDVDCLLNVSATFAGLCPYAAQLDLGRGVKTQKITCQKDKTEDAALMLAGNIKHVRNFCSRALGDILEAFDGDIERTLGVILKEETGGKFGLPPTYRQLIETCTRIPIHE